MRLCPWADVVYGCDGPWWKSRNGLQDYHGVKLSHDTAVCAAYSDIHKIEIIDRDKLLLDEPGVVGSGGNSAFQALNLAVQFGVNRVLLIGCDMHTGAGLHWYGRNTWPAANNPSDQNLMRWRDGFERLAPQLKAMGVEVINASSESALVCFPHKTIAAALEAWDL